ncbi:MAG: hypothetical protein A2X86_06095 [Bdellovibrionales bacterium GWA2_49_15]|nr:MAG: hypothetical protein A2X86_06095 [Bdellovibrionales bacterium GWA2_49_15]HAZ14633.1 hypothetical protein [Bdellovibrionales bacterium]
MNRLFVFYDREPVGILEKNSDATLSFSYGQKWRESDHGISISPILDLKYEGNFDNRATRSYFDNLLPEGKIRALLEKLVGKSLTNDFQFLEKFGVDCAGAFIITPNQDCPKQVVRNEFQELDIHALSKAYLNNENLMGHVMEKHRGRFSLAGAQDKVPLVYMDEKLYIPTSGIATTHILKPPHFSKSVKDSVYNEYFSMTLAAACGLNVPKVFVVESEVPFYIVERFDRKIITDEVKRLHQVDFCQAQGYLVEEKYEEDGGPNLKSNYLCIKKNSSDFTIDAKNFMRWISFNMLLGNNDCHSKNISFLRHDGGYRLSPFYDLLCTSIYKEYSSEFAFKLGGNGSWGQWKKEHFEKEMVSWGLDKSPRLLLETLTEVKETILANLGPQLANFRARFPTIKVAGRIKEEIRNRVHSFEKRLK